LPFMFSGRNLVMLCTHFCIYHQITIDYCSICLIYYRMWGNQCQFGVTYLLVINFYHQAHNKRKQNNNYLNFS